MRALEFVLGRFMVKGDLFHVGFIGRHEPLRGRIDLRHGNRGRIAHLLKRDLLVRVNLGLFQHDVNVIWDLAVHDLSIIDYVLPTRPCAVSATGMSHVKGRPENIAFLSLFYENNMIGHIHVNWLSPVKVRRMLIGGTRKMIVYDDLEPSEKIKVYDKGITVNNNTESVYQMLIGYRTGDMWAPQLDMTEALRAEVLHFVHCIEKGERPMTDGQAGLRVVQTMEAATHSMANQGQPIELRTGRV